MNVRVFLFNKIKFFSGESLTHLTWLHHWQLVPNCVKIQTTLFLLFLFLLVSWSGRYTGVHTIVPPFITSTQSFFSKKKIYMLQRKTQEWEKNHIVIFKAVLWPKRYYKSYWCADKKSGVDIFFYCVWEKSSTFGQSGKFQDKISIRKGPCHYLGGGQPSSK